MSPLTLPPAAAAYLAQLERELADMPAEERVDLLEEVEASLLEGGDEPVARLGTPTRFAAELRASAGLPPAPSVPPPRRPSAWARFKKDSRVRAAGSVARELAPIWWVARAAVLVALLGLGVQSRYAGLLPRLTGHLSLDIAIVALVPIASVALGLAGRRRPLPVRGVRVAADLALAACLVFVPGLVDELHGRVDGIVYVQSTPPPPAGLANDGVSLRNVYTYDREGRLLHD